jgi:2-methylfumaryl-CoA hydratase
MTKSTTNHNRYFEDFKLGETILHATPRTVTEGDASLYIALTGSRHIIHCAQPVAHSLGYENRTIDDLLAFHIAFGKTVADISVNAVANLGYAEITFDSPIYAGDTLTTSSTVIGVKENSTKRNGIVYVRSTTLNQNHKQVLSWVRWVMIHKRDFDSPAPKTVVPDLSTFVTAQNLPVINQLDFKDFDIATTGSDKLWDDYIEGERINHPAGMTVDDSDHTLATKLYQNNAKLHFDSVLMQSTSFGRRLMYGGHVISICRALSYDGLENAISIAAINSGTHSNPSFGGDTFYCWTEVLEKWTLPKRNDIGALRLRMVGIKNQTADSLDSSHIIKNNKRQYHPNIVLDLDYTVLIPRRAPKYKEQL